MKGNLSSFDPAQILLPITQSKTCITILTIQKQKQQNNTQNPQKIL